MAGMEAHTAVPAPSLLHEPLPRRWRRLAAWYQSQAARLREDDLPRTAERCDAKAATYLECAMDAEAAEAAEPRTRLENGQFVEQDEREESWIDAHDNERAQTDGDRL